MEEPGRAVALRSRALPAAQHNGNVRGHLDGCAFEVSKPTASFRSFFIPLILTLPFENVPIYSFKKKLIWPIISCCLRKGSKGAQHRTALFHSLNHARGSHFISLRWNWEVLDLLLAEEREDSFPKPWDKWLLSLRSPDLLAGRKGMARPPRKQTPRGPGICTEFLHSDHRGYRYPKTSLFVCSVLQSRI